MNDTPRKQMNIQPIKLLRGTHPDTGQTGQGCFMNVIAYLNGEAQITDRSPCVCVTIRPIVIFLNDNTDDTQRQLLLPYILRVMGSATQDVPTLVARAQAAARLAKRCAEEVAGRDRGFGALAGHTEAEALQAAEWAARASRVANADDVAPRASRVANAAANAANAAHVAGQESAILYCLEYLDEVCPPASEPTAQQLAHAQELVALYRGV